MADLARQSLAAQLGAGDPAARAPGVTVRLIDAGALYLVTDPASDLAPNERRGDFPYRLWLAPDRALLVAGPAPSDGFVSDVTDGFATFEIAGPRAAEIVAMGCTLDPHGLALASGRCAQTAFAGVKVVLYAEAAGEKFRLHAERSLAAWLLEWFTQAASALP